MGRQKTNKCYSYFHLSGCGKEAKAVCKVNACAVTLKCPSATNLKKHLERYHQNEFNLLNQCEQDIAQERKHSKRSKTTDKIFCPTENKNSVATSSSGIISSIFIKEELFTQDMVVVKEEVETDLEDRYGDPLYTRAEVTEEDFGVRSDSSDGFVVDVKEEPLEASQDKEAARDPRPDLVKMASGPKRRKVDRERRRFQDKWKLDYFFAEIGNKCVCMICRESVAVFKEFNIKRHYQTKHSRYHNLTGVERRDKLKELEAILSEQEPLFAGTDESGINTRGYEGEGGNYNKLPKIKRKEKSKQLEARVAPQQRSLTRTHHPDENAIKASYSVAMVIAKHCRAFTDGEFIKDCMMAIVETMFPENKEEFATISLDRDTVEQRIGDLSSDIKRQLKAKAAEFDFFSLSCHEIPDDASGTLHLLIFLRGVDDEMNVTEELLDFHSLENQKRSEMNVTEELLDFHSLENQERSEMNVTEELLDFHSLENQKRGKMNVTEELLDFHSLENQERSEMNVTEELLDFHSLENQKRGTDLPVSVRSVVEDLNLSWNKVTGVITDGEPTQSAKESRLSAQVCNEVIKEGGEPIQLDCIIDQQLLCAKHLKYDHVIEPVMKGIGYIQSRWHPDFEQFLLDIEAEYEDDWCPNDARWLSRGTALQRFYALRKEIGEFLGKSGQPMPVLSDPIWLADFGFLVDVTGHLNVLNTRLQGQNESVIQLYSHIKAFGMKLRLFRNQLTQPQPKTSHFSSLEEIMTSFPEVDVSARVRRYAADISSLAEEFERRLHDFAPIDNQITLVSSPFSQPPDNAPHHLQLELIDLQCDAESRNRYEHLPLMDFYRQLDKTRFPGIRTLAQKTLSLFGSTSLYHKASYVINNNKINDSRTGFSHSHLRDILRIRTTTFEPDFHYLIQARS